MTSSRTGPQPGAPALIRPVWFASLPELPNLAFVAKLRAGRESRSALRKSRSHADDQGLRLSEGEEGADSRARKATTSIDHKLFRGVAEFIPESTLGSPSDRWDAVEADGL
jgi:hypothetical protein